MKRERRWGVGCALLVSLLTCTTATATATTGARYRSWHGVRVVNLQAAPVASLAGARRRPQYVIPAPTARRIQLSNEQTLTRWANPSYRGAIYSRPEDHARRTGRLHMRTEDGFPEVYVLLGEYVTAAGRAWVQVRVPARPNGEIGWVRRGALGPFGLSRWRLVVDRRTDRITAYHNGHRAFGAPVGVGKPSTPTPAGRFWIRERFRVLDPLSPYWPYALGTSDYSVLSEWPGGGVVGIHGEWGQPQLIPGDPSHGCIRMHNADISWLAPRVPVGTPLRVL